MQTIERQIATLQTKFVTDLFGMLRDSIVRDLTSKFSAEFTQETTTKRAPKKKAFAKVQRAERAPAPKTAKRARKANKASTVKAQVKAAPQPTENFAVITQNGPNAYEMTHGTRTWKATRRRNLVAKAQKFGFRVAA